MKKPAVFLISVLLTALVSGCGSAAPKNGVYTAEYADFDSHGWKAFVEVTAADGEFRSVIFDYRDADGNLKSADENYKSAYLDAGFGT